MEGKKTMGRRRIEIKKIEKRSSLRVTFTKRRGGLFRKASELAVLCGAEVAIIVQSPAKKIYTFSHPSVEALLNRLSLSPATAEAEAEASSSRQKCEEERRKCEEAVKMLEMEKEKEKTRAAEAEAEAEAEKKGGLWWEEPHEGLELHELEEFCTALEGLREKVEERLKEFENSQSAAPQPQPQAQAQEGFAASSSDSFQFDGLFKDYDDDCLDLFDLINFSA